MKMFLTNPTLPQGLQINKFGKMSQIPFNQERLSEIYFSKPAFYNILRVWSRIHFGL